jgi:aminoglycoside phosphotransferase (APT) family kinase protein
VALDPLHGVLSPPEVARFRALAHLGDEPLELNFDGWSKLAVLSKDRVFLFPRRGREPDFLHGARACEALCALGVGCVPEVLDRWSSDELPSGPCVAFVRRPGRSWSSLEDKASFGEWERVLSSLGEAIATWHGITAERLPADLARPARFSPKGALSRMLEAVPIDALLSDAAPLAAGEPTWLPLWRSALGAVRAAPPVLLHGDVCENQLLVDGELRVTTVLDWDTAGLGNRLHDFDFGEWGLGIYRWEAEFARLRQVCWGAYRAALGAAGADLPPWEVVHLVFVLAELLHLEQRSGTLDGWSARRQRQLRLSIGPATAAAAACLRG